MNPVFCKWMLKHLHNFWEYMNGFAPHPFRIQDSSIPPLVRLKPLLKPCKVDGLKSIRS